MKLYALQTQRAVDELEDAVARLEGLPYPLERARSLICLGVAYRNAKQKRLGRERLEQALAILDELGAPLWTGRARDELARISGRRPLLGRLTETEQRVAALAADGLSNKEIAAALFIGVGTVEQHLSRVYRKLGIRSRSQLARQLAAIEG